MTCLVTPLGYVGVIGHACGVCAHFAAIVVTGVFRYSSEGQKCAENEKEIIYDSSNDEFFKFQAHGKTIEGTFIAACILFFYFNCFTCFMMKVSKYLIQAKRDKVLN